MKKILFTTVALLFSTTIVFAGTYSGGDIASGIDNATPVGTPIGGVHDLHTADVDNDGDVDVLTASRAHDAIAWYENTDGQGSFSDKQVIASGVEQANGVTTADLNGDGNLDVLSTSAADDTVAWYAGDGQGEFGQQQVISSAEMGPQDLHAADLDGDGDLDVVTASFYDDTVAWYENDGAGGFGSRQVISTDVSGAKAVTAADLNGDGTPDVIATGKMDGKTVWFANDGAGNFDAANVVTTDPAANANAHLVD